MRVMRVSDDDYWKDFPGEVKSLTPRLLQTDLLLTRPFGDWSAYARALKWQVLQTVDPTTRIDPPPYERAPQIGARYAGPWRGGLDVAFEGEFNRFANPERPLPARAPDRPARARARQHPPAVLLAGLDADAQAVVQRRVLRRSTCRSPTAGAARPA